MIHQWNPLAIGHLLGRLVHLLKDRFITAPVSVQFLRCTETDEASNSCHIDPVAIRVTDLRGRGNNDDLLWTQSAEDLQDALPQGRSADDAVVKNHQIILR